MGKDKALTLSIVSAGTYSFDPNPDLYHQNETVLFSHIVPLPNPTTLDLLGTFSTSTSVATYSNGVDSFTLDFVFTNTTFAGGAKTDQGTWTWVGGTAAYATVTGGTGTYSATYNAADGNFSSTTIAGNLDAVPEPASMAVVGIGLLGLARRRRKA